MADGKPGPDAKPVLATDLDKKRFKVEKWTLFFLILYTTVATLGLFLTRNAVSHSDNNFVASQMPYIWPTQNPYTHIFDQPIVKVGEKIRWDIWLKNYGTTPAQHFMMRMKIVTASDGQTPQAQKAVEDQVFAPLHVAGYEELGSVMPPGDATLYTTVLSDQYISTDQEVKDILNSDAGVGIFIYCEYYDNAGQLHHTKASAFRLASGAISFGGRYLEIK